jgi:hypothetical protein
MHRNDNFENDQGLFADLSYQNSISESESLSQSNSYSEPKLLNHNSVIFGTNNTTEGLIPIGS